MAFLSPIAACAPGFSGNRLVQPVGWMYSGHLIPIRPQLSPRPQHLFQQALQMLPHHPLLTVRLETCGAKMVKDIAFQGDGPLRVLQFPPRLRRLWGFGELKLPLGVNQGVNVKCGKSHLPTVFGNEQFVNLLW